MQLGLALAAGSYVIRGPQLASQLAFQVVAESVANSDSSPALQGETDNVVSKTTIATQQEFMNTMDFQRESLLINLASAADWAQPNIKLRSHQQLIDVHNGFEREMIVRIERSAPRIDALTAAAIMAMPLYRELFPGQAFAKSQLATMSRITLLQTKSPSIKELKERYGDTAEAHLHRHFYELAEVCSQHNGTWIKIVDQGALIAFVNHDDAVECAHKVQATIPESNEVPVWLASVAVVTGTTSITMIGGQLDYLGAPADALRELLNTAKPGDVLIENIVG